MDQTDQEAAERIAENRRRYEALKFAGTGQAPRSMPPATTLDAAPIGPSSIIARETIPGGWYANYRLKRGERLRIVNSEGSASAALLAWSASDPSERLNHADTIKIQWTAALQKGRVLFSDMGRVLLSIVEDTSGAHDVLVGGSSPAGNLERYGANHAIRDTQTNMLLAAAKFGLGPRDIPPLVAFFAPVSVDEAGRIGWNGDRRQAGDFVELRAEADLLIAISNCPHPLDPAAAYAPGPLEITRLVALPVDAADPCRTATPEAVRGFENTDAFLA